MSTLSAGPVTVQNGTDVRIRALGTADDYLACVQLQQETWGAAFADYVPASLLKVVQLVGGVTVGAFTADGRMIGFVFGLTGIRDGRAIHWSHMLAVRREYRDHGLGRQLKEYQRDLLRAQGVDTILWTFDPLVARNAHLNLNRLGTEVREYVRDMYGDTGSPLHTFGTDRLVVAWSVVDGVDAPLAVPSPLWRAAALAGSDAHDAGRGNGRPVIRIEIPSDVEALDAGKAREWRLATRSAFVRLMGDGYRVVGFYTERRERCYYVLAHPGEGGARG